ncbi:MAG: PEGA domain-containing protein [Clostridiales bacterium]|jgi:hypothetical protein|nr:PEGA domain-containing protein [Clostridiales bacterium]
MQGNNRDDLIRKPPAQKHDGVIYEPSGRAPRQRHSTYKPPGAELPRPPQRVSARRYPSGDIRRYRSEAQARKSNSFTAFYIITLFIGMVICVVIFAIVFNSFGNTPPPSLTQTPEATLPAQTVVNDIRQTTAIVAALSVADGSVRLTDLTTETTASYNLLLDSQSTMKDKYGNAMIFAQFNVGDIVDVSFNAADSTIEAMDISAKAWEHTQITDARIDPEAGTITVGNNRYGYTGQLMTYYNGAPYELGKIESADVLTIRGYRDKAWFINLMKGHGALAVTGKDEIKGGKLEIDTSIYMELDNASSVEVPEGTHRIVVKGDNIEPYIVEGFVINHDSVETLDLSGVTFLEGRLIIVPNVPNCTVTLDDTEVSIIEPLELLFGEYAVKVEKEGYLPYEGTVIIDAPSQELNVELEKEAEIGRLIVTTEPAGAEVYVNDERIGVSPVESELEYGDHTITIRLEGHNIWTKTITIDKPESPYNIIMQPIVATEPPAITFPPSEPPASPTPSPADSGDGLFLYEPPTL